jgi:hypothetical protein
MGRYEAIEEVLADMAGEGKASDLRGWDRLLAFLRQVIQSMAHGIGVNIPVTDAMVEQLVAGIRKEGMRDTPAFVVQSNKGPMFLRVFHGTPHEVDRFSTDKIGTGEGAQAYGWGIYFASSRDVAEHYRKTLSQKFDARQNVADTYINQAGGNREKAVSAFKEYVGYDTTGPFAPSAADKADFDETIARIRNQGGRLYEVNIPDYDGEAWHFVLLVSFAPRQRLVGIAVNGRNNDNSSHSVPRLWESSALGT